MNYLSGAFRYVARGETETQNNVSRLVDRIKTSVLPHDRRTAIIQLTEAAKESPQRQVEVGELGLKTLYAVLEQDVDYDETIKAALDLLIAICGRLDPSKTDENTSGDPAQHEKALNASREFEDATAKAAATNVDVFLGLPNALALLLQLLEKGDFYVKFGTIELLTAMGANSRQTLQMAVLEAAQGVTRICDLLDDTHRHIRSNAVLLLSALCENSPEICKIVAFGGFLEKLFGLIDTLSDSKDTANIPLDDPDEEDTLEAAIVIQDVLLVIRNLITGTSTTKTFFRETGCLQRLVAVIRKSANDARMLHTEDNELERKQAVGLGKTAQQQAGENLKFAITCVTDLVSAGDEESNQAKNDLFSTSLLQTLVNVAFFREPDTSGGTKASINVLSTRVSAFRAISSLLRGHDSFRQAFADEQYRDGLGSENTCVQVATMNVILRDPSAAIRAAAYATLRDSFVVDSGLDMPSSALIEVLADAGSRANDSSSTSKIMFHSSTAQGREEGLSDSPSKVIASTLKEALVGYPSMSDSAGVFYASSFISWVLRALQGAKEQLLTTHVRGSTFLSQVIRVLGKVEREQGAAEVRISLFTLICEWLYGSPTAVSAFLSSAMHLPMLVDVLRNSGSRGDIAEVHTRGLSAVILGICLRSADDIQETVSNSSMLSQKGGSSTVIPQSAVSDVIRNRIGVTVFTSCLDDLRATRSFSAPFVRSSQWKLIERLVQVETGSGLLSLNGSIGHENWYSENAVELVNNVYQTVAEKVLDLVADSNHGVSLPSRKDGKAVIMNGHANANGEHPIEKAMLADSAQDEVINSYKEFIRKQDESLNAAKSQIEELSAALRQAQLELDKTSNGTFLPGESELSVRAKEEREELLAQKKALEDLLEEKTGDFEALSRAFTALEAEHNDSSQGLSVDRSEEMAADLQRMKTQTESLKNAMDSEVRKNEELSRRANLLDDTVKLKDVQLDALVSERNSLQTNAHPEVIEALQWRTRAEVAEAKIRSRQELIDSYQNSNAVLQDQLREIERTRDEALSSVTAFTKRFNATKSELESLRATRRLELQVSREASAASDASATNEIESLKEQLKEAKQMLDKEIASKAKLPSTVEVGRVEQMQSEYQAVVNAYEKVKTELMDSKQAVIQWQKRAEASKAARQREGADNNRVVEHARSLEEQLKELNDSLLSQKQSVQASTTRVSELEEQCKEIDEIRKHTEEELITLKEQLASRTEQSIRLSGRLYEIEESKEKLEQNVEELRAVLSSRSTRIEKVDEQQSINSLGGRGVDPNVEEPSAKLAQLQEELEVTRDALTDSKDRESLSNAHAKDRESMVAKIDLLEHDLSATRAAREKLEEDMSDMKERLLSLDEAEASKKALTMQVVSLQQSLAGIEKEMHSPGVSTGQLEKIKSLERKVEHLQNRCDEKDIRMEGLGSSLTLALDRAKTAEREERDMQKQVSETEAMFSVLRSERDCLMEEKDSLTKEKDCLLKEKEELHGHLDELSPLVETDAARLEEVQKKLVDAEKMRDAVSQELASLVAAVKISERDSKQLKDDRITLNKSLINAKRELSETQDECKKISLSQSIDDIVSGMLTEVSLTTQASSARKAIETLQLEKHVAAAALEASRTELQIAKDEMAKLPFLIKQRGEATEHNKKLESRISALSEELVGLQEIANERDTLSSSLDAALARTDRLAEEKASTVSALEEANARITDIMTSSLKRTSVERESQEDFPVRRRVEELEEALRDAAKTVTATNSELMAAQSLLVDLSADKTAMRTELSSAQERINELIKQVTNLSRSAQAVPALSEVSEQEQSFGECASVSPGSVVGELDAEGKLQSVQAEAINLRTALQRSMTEAESVADLVNNIEARIAGIETMLKESHDKAINSQKSADDLNTELHRLRECYRSEKESFEKDADVYRTRIRDLEVEIEQTKEIWKESLSISEESWTAERGKLQNALTDMKDKLNIYAEKHSNLQNRLDEAVEELEDAKIVREELKLSKHRLSSSLKSLEEERSQLKELLDAAAANEESQKDSLQRMREELQSAKELSETDRKRTEERHKNEVKDLEDELDRASNAMETAERTFRDAEMSLKFQITQEKELLRDMERQQRETRESLRVAQADIQRISLLKEQVEATLTETVRQQDVKLTALYNEKNDVQNTLELIGNQSTNLRKSVEDMEMALKETKRDLNEEIEQKMLLESENHDFLSTVSALENSSKRTRSELSQKTKDLNQAQKRMHDLQSDLEAMIGRLKDIETEVANRNDEIRLLEEANNGLKKRENELEDKLKNTEESRDSLAQDNKDLLAWVSDLEKRATELQSAASDFQEVEQNLRDALESQRYASEQNSKLVEDLKKERTSLSTAQARVLQMEREREEAHAERDSYKRRAREVEARIREIREHNLVKYSQSEEAIRTKAKQCAELETALAASQRKVAELESVSDDLFGATTSLKQLNEEMGMLKNRAVSAEETAEVLRKELQVAQAEVSEVREHSSLDALQSLEAEHNELLVYLADLELEVTNLREELGRE